MLQRRWVTASTILRYENGSIDNTKKMVLEGLSEALHVSIEWLRGETDEYETDITDKKELQIRDAMGDILKQLPLDLSKKEDAFSKDLLLLMLKQYNLLFRVLYGMDNRILTRKSFIRNGKIMAAP